MPTPAHPESRSRWARFRNRYTASQPPILDDRGKPLPPTNTINPFDAVKRLIQEANPKAEDRRRSIAFVCYIGFAVLVAVQIMRAPSLADLLPRLLGSLWVPAIFVSYHLYQIIHARRTRDFTPPLSTNSATLLATGHCGCCGYPLTALQSEHDNCVVCPECSAAWNVSRFTLVPHPQHAAARIESLRLGSMRFHLYQDDRGVLLTNPVKWPPGFSMKSFPPRFRDAIEGTLNAHRSKQIRTRLVIVAAFWCFTSLAFVINLDARDRTWGFMIFILTVFTLIAGTLAYAVFRFSLPVRQVRLAYLERRCCPNCHSLIPNTPPAFDSCIPCQLCEHAWRADALGTPPPDPQLSHVPCHSCGYNTVNLPICPECGTVMPKTS